MCNAGFSPTPGDAPSSLGGARQGTKKSAPRPSPLWWWAVLKQNVRTERTPAAWRRAALRQCGGPRGSPHAGKTSHRRGP